jgi:transposase
MDTLLMNTRERRRLTELSLVKQGRSSVAEAARRLGLSPRQTRRLWKRFKAQGDGGLIHRLRGKESNFADAARRKKVLALYREKYLSFNAAHACEMLEREDDLAVPRQTLWRWLKAQGLVAQPRRVRKHRQRRLRRGCIGELIQMDGSTHRWLGEDLPECVAFVMIDDATGEVFCRFYESEDTASAFDLFGRYARTHGLPKALYVDHDSIYCVNDPKAREKALFAGKPPPLTQFGRAMAELAVAIIAANSPQAKGRVERVNRTLQDRLLKELALHLGGGKLRELAAANAFLEKQFLPRFNSRFGKAPREGVNMHRAVAKELPLENVLCIKETRVVSQDWCVRYASRFWQIDRRHESLKLAGKTIEVWQDAQGGCQFRHRGEKLKAAELLERPATPQPSKPRSFNPPWKPAANHPWRTGGKEARVAAAAPLQSASLRSASLRSAAAATRNVRTTHASHA